MLSIATYRNLWFNLSDSDVSLITEEKNENAEKKTWNYLKSQFKFVYSLCAHLDNHKITINSIYPWQTCCRFLMFKIKQITFFVCMFVDGLSQRLQQFFCCCLFASSFSGLGVGSEKVLQNKWMVHLFNFISMFFFSFFIECLWFPESDGHCVFNCSCLCIEKLHWTWINGYVCFCAKLQTWKTYVHIIRSFIHYHAKAKVLKFIAQRLCENLSISRFNALFLPTFVFFSLCSLFIVSRLERQRHTFYIQLSKVFSDSTTFSLRFQSRLVRWCMATTKPDQTPSIKRQSISFFSLSLFVESH